MRKRVSVSVTLGTTRIVVVSQRCSIGASQCPPMALVIANAARLRSPYKSSSLSSRYRLLHDYWQFTSTHQHSFQNLDIPPPSHIIRIFSDPSVTLGAPLTKARNAMQANQHPRTAVRQSRSWWYCVLLTAACLTRPIS